MRDTRGVGKGARRHARPRSRGWGEGFLRPGGSAPSKVGEGQVRLSRAKKLLGLGVAVMSRGEMSVEE